MHRSSSSACWTYSSRHGAHSGFATRRFYRIKRRGVSADAGPEGPACAIATSRSPGYLPMTKVSPASLEPLYRPSVVNVALSGYDPGFWLSLMLADAFPFEAVVPIALWVPSANAIFL